MFKSAAMLPHISTNICSLLLATTFIVIYFVGTRHTRRSTSFLSQSKLEWTVVCLALLALLILAISWRDLNGYDIIQNKLFIGCDCPIMCFTPRLNNMQLPVLTFITRVINIPQQDNSGLEAMVNDTIEEYLEIQEQLEQEAAIKRKRKIFVKIHFK